MGRFAGVSGRYVVGGRDTRAAQVGPGDGCGALSTRGKDKGHSHEGRRLSGVEGVAAKCAAWMAMARPGRRVCRQPRSRRAR